MDSISINKIKHISNNEVIKRLLIKYFIDKGFNSFNSQMHPALLQDLPYTIPILFNKLEVTPHVYDIDQAIGKATISWNLFVLGSHRMYLGDTFHNNLVDLARQIRSKNLINCENSHARKQTTPKNVIVFILRILSKVDAGYVDLSAPNKSLKNLYDDPYVTGRVPLTGIPQQVGRSGAF